jgi:tetratricopeptide (TPR) repeat protein
MPSAAELQQRAIDFARTGDFGAEALAVNLELSRVAPTNEGAWTRLSRCYMETGQLDAATMALDTVLRINPQNTIARSLQTEVMRRRMASIAPVRTPRAPRSASSAGRAPRESTSGGRGSRAGSDRGERTRGAAVAGFGRAEFVTLGQLAPAAAVEALSGRLDALLMALNDRGFAAKAVEMRNRAGQSGARLFRRNTLQAAGPGHIRAFHQGGRREPQLAINFFSSTPWGRDAIGVGIGFDVSPDALPREQERALAYFARFQQLVAGAFRPFLAQWMSGSGGFIQVGPQPPSTDLLPDDALARLIAVQNAVDLGWIFYGRWLFADRLPDGDIVADGRRLVAWIDTSFSDLLPVWSSLYRA